MPLRDVRLIVPLIIDDTMMQHLQFVPLAGRVLAYLCSLLVLVADGGAQALSRQRVVVDVPAALGIEYAIAGSPDGVLPVIVPSTFGPLSTTTHGEKFRAQFSPQQQTYIRARLTVVRLAPMVLVYAGQAFDASFHAFISHDAGLTWSYLRPLAIPSGSFTATNGRYARHFESFTTDTGRTWTEYPLPDSLQQVGNTRFLYVGAGRFAIRDRKTARWYEVDATTGVYTEANIPYAVRDVFLLPNGDVLGTNRDSAPTTTIWRRRRDAADFVPDTLPVPDGMRADSINVVRSTMLANGMLAMVCETVPAGRGWLLVTDGDTARTVAAWEVADSLQRIASVGCSGGNTVLLLARNGTGSSALIAVDMRTWQSRVVPIRGRTRYASAESFNALFMNDTLATTINGDGSVHILDLRTGEIRIGGEVEDPYDRFDPVRQDAAVMVGGRVLMMDETGTVYEQRNDTSAVLRAWGAGMSLQQRDNDADRFFRRVFAATLVHGIGHLWDADGDLLTGGAQLRLIDAAGTAVVLRPDTTTFWLRRADGTQLAGHRSVQRRGAADTSFADHATIADGRAVIRGMVETSDGTLVAALRGYVHTVDGGEPDTLQGGLWRSVDGGLTWTKAAVPVDDGMALSVQRRAHDGSLWACVTTALRETINDSVAEANLIPAETMTLGAIHLLRSTDQGLTWHVVHRQDAAGSFAPSSGGVTFAGNATVVWATHDRVQWSDDDGATWRNLDGLGGATTTVGQAAFDADGHLWVAASDGIYRADRPTSVEAEVAESRSNDGSMFRVTTYPNPTDRTLTVRLHNMDRLRGDVETLFVMDLLGRVVADLRPHIPGHRPAGIVDIPLDLGPVPPGPYVLSARTSERTITWPIMVAGDR